MKIKELIAELQGYDPELNVSLADWNEEYATPTLETCICGVFSWQEWIDKTGPGRQEKVVALVLGVDPEVTAIGLTKEDGQTFVTS